MPSIYQETLGGDQFRLISILPAENSSAELECDVTIVYFDSEETPPYEALSYVWGDPDTKSEIMCNGQPLMVTLNLQDALTRLRMETCTRLIWADGICIDQANGEEKNHQVPLMWKIYSNATRVVVWLGPSIQDEASCAARSLRAISDPCRKYERRPDFNKDSLIPYSDLRLPESTFRDLQWEPLQKLFSLPWFERVWCVQEIQLARDAILIWGEQEIPSSDVRFSSLWAMSRGGRNMHRNRTELFWAIKWSNVVAMFREEMKQRKVLTILLRYKQFKATDPRDKIYGLINLMRRDAIDDHLVVDYKRTVAEIYVDISWASTQETYDLEILSWVFHPPEYDGNTELKSWIPRWDRKRENQKAPLFTSLTTSSSACKDMLMDATLEIGRLKVRGLLFEQVVRVRPLLQCIDLLYGEAEGNTYIGDHIEETLAQQSPEALESAAKALANTLTAGSTAGIARYSSSIAVISDEERAKYYSEFSDYMSSTFPNIYAQYGKTFDSLKLQELSGYWKYAELLGSVCDQRRLFYTEAGSYGLGPACMREGDVVVVLFGGEIPYVLRPKDAGYLFLGQAYVDKIATGQLVDDMRAGKIQDQEFCLI